MCNIKLQAATEEKINMRTRYELENTNKKQVILSPFPKASSEKVYLFIIAMHVYACICIFPWPL